MCLRTMINSWMLHNRGKFLGFSEIEGNYISNGITVENETVIPLFVFEAPFQGWGDDILKSTKKYPFVLYMSGNDDRSFYKLFRTEAQATKYGNKYVRGDRIINIEKELNWNFQN